MGPELLKCERAPWMPSQRENKTVTYSRIMAEVCRRYEIDPERVSGRCRTSREVAARHEVWFELHRKGWSASAIARCAGRDHTTVVSALQKSRRDD